MKTILKYPGAKNRLAKWIVSFITEHDVYLEPFAGRLAVLLNKPKAKVETINDLHDLRIDECDEEYEESDEKYRIYIPKGSIKEYLQN